MSQPEPAGLSSGSLSIKWNEFADLLGGASWAEACSEGSFDLLSPQSRQQLPLLASRFSEHSQFLFTDSTGSIKPLEILWLKWRLFGGLCARVLQLYQTMNRPSLGIRPDQIVVVVPSYADSLSPVRWNFSLDLLSPNGAENFVNELMPPEYANRLFAPPHVVDNLYQAPELKMFPLGKIFSGSVMIRSMERIRRPVEGSGEVQGLVQLHLFQEQLASAMFSDKDVFFIKFSTMQDPVFSVGIWASKAESVERGLSLNGTTLPVTLAQWEHLQAQRQQVFVHSEIVPYRAFHTPCDLYSLGVLLLQLLIGRKKETIERLEARLPVLVGELQKIVSTTGRQDQVRLGERFQWLLAREGRLFQKEALMHGTMRSPKLTDEIPDDLWYEVLQIGFRLFARIPDFGFCQHSGDYDLELPHEPLQRAMGEIERVGKWIQQDLFGSSERNREILKACRLLKEELLNREKVNHAL